MTSIIEIDQATKRFGQQTAVDNVSLTVPSGCVFALLGENGAGKTTLVKMLLGLMEADEGKLNVLGLACNSRGDEIRQRIGYVPERPTLYEWMTASEIGWFTAGFYPDGFEQHYRNLLDRYKVPLQRKIREMSKGMRAKVALSLAMAHQPELLILDEPTSGLDTLVRREFLESMVDIAAEGRTVLLSSHLIGEVERVADRVAIIREGQLLKSQSLDEMKQSALEVTVTMQGSAAATPTTPGTVLQSRKRGKQWRLLVLDIEDPTQIEQLRDSESVVAVDTRTPSLEEIFVAFMQTNAETTAPEPKTSQPTPIS